MELFIGGSVINMAYPVYFLQQMPIVLEFGMLALFENFSYKISPIRFRLGPVGSHVKKWETRRQLFYFYFHQQLEDTARYAGLLLAPLEGRGRGFFCPSGKKRAYYAVLSHFWQFLVSSSNLVTFSSNISNFERNHQNQKNLKKNKKKIKNNEKNPKIQKNPKK